MREREQEGEGRGGQPHGSGQNGCMSDLLATYLLPFLQCDPDELEVKQQVSPPTRKT